MFIDRSPFDGLLFTLTLVTTLGCGVIGGLFFAFSVSVMKALARLPAAEGMAAMQSINVVILNPMFLSVFFGTGLGCAVVMTAAFMRWHSASSLFLLAGGALYLLGSLLVTVVFNVPRNQALASEAPAGPGASKLWAEYLAKWTAWNHVRTVASIAAAALLTLGLCY